VVGSWRITRGGAIGSPAVLCGAVAAGVETGPAGEAGQLGRDRDLGHTGDAVGLADAAVSAHEEQWNEKSR
jgi:hypothetical protein